MNRMEMMKTQKATLKTLGEVVSILQGELIILEALETAGIRTIDVSIELGHWSEMHRKVNQLLLTLSGRNANERDA